MPKIVKSNIPVKPYSMRRMPIPLLERMHRLKPKLNKNIEQIVILCIDLALPRLEREAEFKDKI